MSDHKKEMFLSTYGNHNHMTKLLDKPHTDGDVSRNIAINGNDEHRAKIMMSSDSWGSRNAAQEHYEKENLQNKSNSDVLKVLKNHYPKVVDHFVQKEEKRKQEVRDRIAKFAEKN